jgi:uncharacterized delta-60 repeat protein
MVFSTLGASQPAAARNSPAEVIPASTDTCATQTVRITLASEQIEFCAPTSLPTNVVEDGASNPQAAYAGLNQIDGYGVVTIKAISAGYAPGPGRPVYTSGQVDVYRQTVLQIESSKTDRVVSNAPTGVFWDVNVPGIQVDVSLPTSSGILQVRSIEWYTEHNDRLWSFMISWDTGMQNANEWEIASGNFTAQKSGSENLADTALNLGTAFQEMRASSEITIQGGPIDVGTPAWWSGVCNDNNFYPATGSHSYVLGSPPGSAVWHGVAACGPFNSMHLVRFFTGAFGEYEFQCVELVMRFLYLQWGIAPFNGNGNTIKDHYPTGSMVFYPNGTHAIVPGDIVTEQGTSPNSGGHAVVVTGVSLNGNGTGTVNILEQNSSSAGLRSLSVLNWEIQPDAWVYGSPIQGWLHVKANQPDGDLDMAFSPGTGPNGRVYALALQPGDGKLLIAGDFTSYNGTLRNRIARLNSSGSLDTTFNPTTGVAITDGSSPHVYTLAIQPDGKVLIGGHFDSYNGNSRNYIARLNSNGTLDAEFVPATAVHTDVFKIAVQTDGKILVGGDNILRLNSDGALDDTFTGSTNNSVHDLAIQPLDGKIIIGGNFSKVDTIDRAGVARLNSNGTLDTSFNPGTGTGAIGVVASIALQADGKILIGGSFSSYNSTARNKIARLNSDGSLDGTFNPGTGLSESSDFVHVLVPQPDGRILIGGELSSYNGTVLGHLGRLNYDGSLDSTFYARTDGEVDGMLLQPDNKIVVGGNFTGYIARLLNHIEPCYTLSIVANPSVAGSVTANPAPNCPSGKYISGTTVQLTAVPRKDLDYWWLNWSGNVTGSSNPVSVSMTANKSVTANFMHSPGTFAKLLPVDTAANQPANLTLSWQTSAGADSYLYCLYTTASSYCNNNSNWVSTGSATIVTLSNLLPSITYHWQVRAKNQVDTTDGGPWWTFVRNGVPAVPVTVSPNGTNFTGSQLPFVWNVSPGATSYHLIVHSLDGSSDEVDDVVVNPSCPGGVCTYLVAQELPVGSYEFKVSAAYGDFSEYSAWRTFSLVVGQKFYLPLVIK